MNKDSLSLEKTRRSEYLCYCAQTKEADFLKSISSGEYKSFNDLCNKTAVGMHCTACILAAEQLYIQTMGESGRLLSPASATRSRHVDKRFSLDAILRRFSPTIPIKISSVCPIISSESIRTFICVSNPIHPKIKADINTIRMLIRIHNRQGRLLKSSAHEIGPDDHLEVELSSALNPDEQSTLATGSATVTLRSKGQGHQGAIRPHFKFVSPSATAAVHTVKASGLHSHLLFTSPDSEQRSFVFIRNMSDKQNNIRTIVRRELGEELFDSDDVLSKNASSVVEIPMLTNSLERLTLDVNTTHQHRAFFLTGDSALTRLSADHI